jgi:hypothetical protein
LETLVTYVGVEVLTAVSTKIAVFWVVAPCSLVEVYHRFALMMDAARTSETTVNFYQTTRRYNPEDSHLRTSNLRSPLKAQKLRFTPNKTTGETTVLFVCLYFFVCLYAVIFSVLDSRRDDNDFQTK